MTIQIDLTPLQPGEQPSLEYVGIGVGLAVDGDALQVSKVYDGGVRMSGPYFAAFCLAVPRDAEHGPRIGFTVPRAFGKAVNRNRVKRRIREAIRLRLTEFAPQWDVVINPRRQALEAAPLDLQRELDRLISRCKKP